VRGYGDIPSLPIAAMNTPDGPARTVPPADSVLEFIFLGTGTSSSLPHVACLTAPAGDPPCRACLAAVTPEGQRNVRVTACGSARAHLDWRSAAGIRQELCA
jgi:hypothetical protein